MTAISCLLIGIIIGTLIGFFTAAALIAGRDEK